MIDPLTGLPDRRGIRALAEQELLRRITSPGPLTLILLDLNDFLMLNYQFGYLGGDEVLRQLGRAFAQTVRPGNHVGRFGGDLFLVVAPETDSVEAKILGEEVRETVEGASFSFDGSEIKLTIRLGIAVAGVGENPTFEQLREAASVAMDEEGRRQKGL